MTSTDRRGVETLPQALIRQDKRSDYVLYFYELLVKVSIWFNNDTDKKHEYNFADFFFVLSKTISLTYLQNQFKFLKIYFFSFQINFKNILLSKTGQNHEALFCCLENGPLTYILKFFHTETTPT